MEIGGLGSRCLLVRSFLRFIRLNINARHVCSSDTLQLQRLMHRDGSTREEASARLGSQLPIAQKVPYADIVIDNSGTEQELDEHVKSLIQTVEKRAGWIWRLSWLFPPFGLFSALWTLLWKRIRLRRNAAQRPSR